MQVTSSFKRHCERSAAISLVKYITVEIATPQLMLVSNYNDFVGGSYNAIFSFSFCNAFHLHKTLLSTCLKQELILTFAT